MTKIEGNILLYFLPMQRSFKASATLGTPVCQVHLQEWRGSQRVDPRESWQRGRGSTGSQPHILCLPLKSTSLPISWNMSTGLILILQSAQWNSSPASQGIWSAVPRQFLLAIFPILFFYKVLLISRCSWQSREWLCWQEEFATGAKPMLATASA